MGEACPRKGRRPLTPTLRGALRLLSAGVLVALLGSTAGAEPEDAPGASLPQGPGLATDHPGDRGIELADGVLVAESFEEGTVADLSKRWSEVKNPGGSVLRFVEDVPAGACGKRALEMRATVGTNTGGHLYRTYDERDVVHLRFYVKFLDKEYIHHFVTLGGYRPATRWPQGHAGKRPRGDERFTVAIEPHGRGGRHAAPGVWSFYDYWHEMKRSADGGHWGNALLAAKPPPVPLNRWQCVEVRVALNSAPGLRDGESALWLDGQPVAWFRKGARRGPWTGMGFRLLESGGEAFEGFSWRTDTRLRANMLSLSLYVTDRAMRKNGVQDPTGRVVRVRFDHVVVADRYVGPFPAALSPRR